MYIWFLLMTDFDFKNYRIQKSGIKSQNVNQNIFFYLFITHNYYIKS